MRTDAKATARITRNDRVLIISIPVSFRQSRGRKQIVVPPGAPGWQPPRPRCDNSLINALARAHRWRRLIETGRNASAAELSEREGINESYLCRVHGSGLATGEDILLDDRVDAPISINHLGDAEVDANRN
jgi:hypothetical protein